MAQQHSHAGHGDRSAETRGRILEAALTEFSANGMAGARTETIAAAAGVNKALIYYYFESKEKLYTATLEMIAERVRDRSLAALERGSSPGERALRAALDHFDRILTQREFQCLMQQEMIRVHTGEESEMSILARRIFAPLHERFRDLMREGVALGEMIDADWLQVMLAAIGANIFYFLSAPMWRATELFEPFSNDALRARRIALVEFLGQAVFVDRRHGAEIAAKVLADTPMPELGEFKGFGPIP